MSDDAAGNLVIYQTDDGRAQVESRLVEDSIWPSQALMGELVDRSKKTSSEHLQNLFEEDELHERQRRVTRQPRRSPDLAIRYRLSHYVCMGLSRSLLMLVLLAAALLFGFPSVLFAGGSRENPVLTTETVSQGFLVEEDIFFLLQYRLWQRRGRFWFVMPIELPSRELLHNVYLYRYNRVALRLEQLATVAQEVPPQSNVRSTKFRLEEEGAAAPQGSTRIIFAWQTGWESEQGLLYDLRVWDPRAGTLTDLVGEHLTAEPLPGEGVPPTRYGGDSPEMQRYFGDYRSPWTDNPGIISITELRAILGEHPGELEWGLPGAQ